MIPREILKKLRQIELRTNPFVTDFVERGCVRIPTGFRIKAQGCDAGATLGIRPQWIPNRNAVAAILRRLLRKHELEFDERYVRRLNHPCCSSPLVTTPWGLGALFPRYPG